MRVDWRVLAEHAQLIRQAVKAQPGISLGELCEKVQADTGVVANGSMKPAPTAGGVSRELKRLNLPRKKVDPRQPARDAAGKGLTQDLRRA